MGSATPAFITASGLAPEMLMAAIRAAQKRTLPIEFATRPRRTARLSCPRVCLDFASLGPAMHFTSAMTQACDTLILVLADPEKSHSFNFAAWRVDGYTGCFLPGAMLEIDHPFLSARILLRHCNTLTISADQQMLLYTIYAIVILTSIWAGVDSHRLQISSSKNPYSWNNGFLSWLLCCLLLWIIAFPAYLFKRAKVLKERATPSNSTLISLLGASAVVAVSLCIAAPFLGWQRLSVEDLRDQVSISIERTWKEDPAAQHVRLKSLSLVHRDGNEYSGVVVADVGGSVEQYGVEVTYDGQAFTWQIK